MKTLDSKKQSRLKGFLFPCIIFIIVVFFLVKGAFYFENISNRQNLDLTRQSIRRATIQCYAIEGIYPADVSYLEENYGLVIDHDKFYIEYGGFASNIMPSIEVYERY